MQTASTVVPNLFQFYFIPEESLLVRSFMQKAAEYALDQDLLTRRLVSVACAICAVAFSFFNAISYLLQIPFKIPLNLVRYDLISLFLDPFLDLSNGIRSFIFVTFGVTYVCWGILRPATVFPFFAPYKEKSQYEINQELVAVIQNLQKTNEELIEQIREKKDYSARDEAISRQLLKEESFAKVEALESSAPVGEADQKHRENGHLPTEKPSMNGQANSVGKEANDQPSANGSSLHEPSTNGHSPDEQNVNGQAGVPGKNDRLSDADKSNGRS